MPFLSQSLYFLCKIHHIWTSWTPFCHFPVIKGWSPRIIIPICQHIEKISKDSFRETLQKLFGKRRKQMPSVPSLCSLSLSLLMHSYKLSNFILIKTSKLKKNSTQGGCFIQEPQSLALLKVSGSSEWAWVSPWFPELCSFPKLLTVCFKIGLSSNWCYVKMLFINTKWSTYNWVFLLWRSNWT